jgi:hypothetical protein
LIELPEKKNDMAFIGREGEETIRQIFILLFKRDSSSLLGMAMITVHYQ